MDNLIKIIDEKIASHKKEVEQSILDIEVVKKDMINSKDATKLKELLGAQNKILFNEGASSALQDIKGVIVEAWKKFKEQINETKA